MSKNKIQIQIIGVGVVGKAFGKALTFKGFTVYLKDINSGVFESSADIFFICTHEQHVRQALTEYFTDLKDKPIVIRSTMTPKAFDALRKEFPELHLSTNPEFLRQKFAEKDSLFPDFHVMGSCCPEHAKLLREILLVFTPYVYEATTPQRALMVKLAHNAFLATIISFWNEIAKMNPEGGRPEWIGGVCAASKRIPVYGTRVMNSPFGGSCLPKDLDQLIDYAEDQGIDPVLLIAVRKINNMLVMKSVKSKI